ncbi:unnamed protein product [Schistosoma mattheei]|uniref:Uncharacterized protein n=1 Tax=Schistosoma mattheei TaxID=31246 RepID=A0A183PGC7_9TREM|nr:unnamed protein product [Schistosoma mattheei]
MKHVESFTHLGSIIDEQGKSNADVKARIGKALGSIIDEHGGSDADVKARIGKARAAFLQLEEHMELKTTFNQYQSENLQYERQDSQLYCTELKLGEI